jgi:hypothetical protein
MSDSASTTLIPGEITVNLTISANTNNYNIWNEVVAQLGYTPTVKVVCTLTINSGVIVGSTSVSSPALDTGTGWPTNSTITVVNNGTIQGKGGKGGNGPAPPATDDTVSGNAGENGGDAFSLHWPVTINNTNGYIWGGGGGGGSSGSGKSTVYGTIALGGSGGSGGSGTNAGAGGARDPTATGGTGGTPSDGNAGSQSAGGGAVPSVTRTLSPIRIKTDAGGAGGGPGQAGSSGGTCYVDEYDSELHQWVNNGSSAGGSGGAAGYAVRRNSNSVTWTGGNNSTQVKGSDA